MLLFTLLLICITVYAASDVGVSKAPTLPSWLSVHKDRELMTYLLGEARKRHVEAIQKAQASYFHGAGAESDEKISSLVMDEYDVKANGKIPDFDGELDRRLYVTSSKTPLFSAEECKDVVSKAEAHFNGGEWTRLPSGQYDVAGIWIRDVPAVKEWFNHMLKERLFPLLVKKFPHFVPDIEDLVCDNAYLFKYTPETGRRTDVHTDSGCLSFTIALNGEDEYDGGGTWFEGLDSGESESKSEIIEMDIGQCTVRPGGVKHCGHAVTKGTRYIIGGFCMSSKKIENVRMLLGLGSEEFNKGNNEKARQAFEAAIALNPDFDGSYSNLADLLTQSGDKAGAKQVLEYCFQNVNPKSGEIAFSLGARYLDEGLIEQTKDCMHVALEADDSDVEAMAILAEAYSKENDVSNESHWCEKIVSTPGASSAAVGQAYCNLGVINAGKEREIEFYKKSIDLLPDRFVPRYSLGCAYATKKDYDRAIETFHGAIDVVEKNSEEDKRALQTLYRCVSLKLQAEKTASSQEEAVKTFMKLIGEDNYQRLASMGR